MILRPIPPGLRRSARVSTPYVVQLESTVAPGSRESYMFHSLAGMIIARRKDRGELPRDPTHEWWQVTYGGLLEHEEIKGVAWHYVDHLTNLLMEQVRSRLAYAPLDMSFVVVDDKDVRVTVRDSRAVDRKAACIKAVLFFLAKPRAGAPRFDYCVRTMLARAVWATRLDAKWEDAHAANKRRKTDCTKRCRGRDMPDVAVAWQHACSVDEDDDDHQNDRYGEVEHDDEDDDDAESFSLQSEDSSVEQDDDDDE
jgi:hypothetical protein